MVSMHTVAGFRLGKLVEAHCSFSTASSIKYKTKQDPEHLVKMHNTIGPCMVSLLQRESHFWEYNDGAIVGKS